MAAWFPELCPFPCIEALLLAVLWVLHTQSSEPWGLVQQLCKGWLTLCCIPSLARAQLIFVFVKAVFVLLCSNLLKPILVSQDYKYCKNIHLYTLPQTKPKSSMTQEVNDCGHSCKVTKPSGLSCLPTPACLPAPLIGEPSVLACLDLCPFLLAILAWPHAAHPSGQGVGISFSRSLS